MPSSAAFPVAGSHTPFPPLMEVGFRGEAPMATRTLETFRADGERFGAAVDKAKHKAFLKRRERQRVQKRSRRGNR